MTGKNSTYVEYGHSTPTPRQHPTHANQCCLKDRTGQQKFYAFFNIPKIASKQRNIRYNVRIGA
jgi:hypothetical protein